ncbi:MAG: hypothetical protein WCV50_02640 [Patescibacteria group bacterium]
MKTRSFSPKKIFPKSRLRFLNIVLAFLITFLPFYPAASALADEPTTSAPINCTDILNNGTALQGIPEGCWAQVAVNENFCTNLFSPDNNVIVGLDSMRAYFTQSCLNLNASPTITTTDPLSNVATNDPNSTNPPAITPDSQNITPPTPADQNQVVLDTTTPVNDGSANPQTISQPVDQIPPDQLAFDTSPALTPPPSDPSTGTQTPPADQATDPNTPPPPPDGIVNATQQASSNTTATSQSNTGTNDASNNNGDVNINTGNATAGVDNQNVINTNIVENQPPAPANADVNSGATVNQLGDLVSNITTPGTDNSPMAPDGQIPTDTPPTADSQNNTNQNSGNNPGADNFAGTTQDATVANTVGVNANTGNNTANNNDGDATVQAGDASALANVVNIINTNVVSGNAAQVVIDVADQFVGNINLLDILMSLLGQGGGNNSISSSTAQQASLQNDINASSNTGGNTTNNNGGDGTVVTGNANSAVNLFNIVNTTIEGSNVLISFVNIFGNWIGNLIVPGQGILPAGQQTASVQSNSQQTATVSNTVVTDASTGSNTASNNNGDSSVSTGQAITLAAIYNSLNNNVTGDNMLLIMPNIFGTWNGTIINNPLGGPINPNQPNGYGFYFTNGASGLFGVSSQNTQDATINNNVYVTAVTGNNSASGNSGDGTVISGQAAALANIINIANTHLMGSNWAFTVINLFGNWQGNLVYAYPDLGITNSNGDHTIPDTVTAGDQVTYTLHYQNTGYAAADQIAIQDTFPQQTVLISTSDGGQANNGVITWDAASLAAQSDVQQVSFTVQVPKDLVKEKQTTTITNHVSIFTQTNEVNLDNNVSGSSLTVVAAASPQTNPTEPTTNNPAAKPKLELTKTNDASAPLNPGQSVTYTIVASSVGDAPIKNLTLNDELKNTQGNVSFSKIWNFDNVPVGKNITVTYSLTIPQDEQVGVFDNTVVATADGIKSISASSSVTVQLPDANSPQIQLPGNELGPTTVPPQPVQTPVTHLIVQKTNNTSGPVSAGTTVNYKVTVANDGDTTVKNVSAKDILTSENFPNVDLQNKNWQMGDIQPGEIVTIAYDVAYSPVTPAGVYVNNVDLTGTASDNSKVDYKASSIIKIKNSVVPTPASTPKILGASTDTGNPPPPSSPKLVMVPDQSASGIKSLLPWWLIAISVIMLLTLYYISYNREQKKTIKTAQ